MLFKKTILFVILSILTSSCALWPYKKDFDCPVTEGLKCKSLHEVSEMADQGIFAPNAIKDNQFKAQKQKSLNRSKRSCCNAS
jgi:hypothetical protein